MEEMAAAYRGSKQIIVRKTDENCGTLRHVVDVATLASGRLIVLAAGDDISKPERAATLFSSWNTTGAWGLCSRFDHINEKGELLALNATVDYLSSLEYPLRKYFLDHQNEVKIIHGATSAYDKELFKFIELESEDYILSEDGALSVLINLLNKNICVIENSLVKYRQHGNSLTNSEKNRKTTFSEAHAEERAIERFAQSQANRCKLFLRLNSKYGESSRTPLDLQQLNQEISRQNMCANWRKTPLRSKLKKLLNLKSRNDLVWYAPRLLPETLFLAAKTIIKNLRNQT